MIQTAEGRQAAADKGLPLTGPVKGLPDRPYVTTTEVAEYFCVPHGRVVQWIRRGELAAVCASISTDSKRPQYRVRTGDVVRFERARLVVPQSRPLRRRRTSYRRIV